MELKKTAKPEAGDRTVPIFQEFHLDHFTPPQPTAHLFLSARGKLILDTSYRSILHHAKFAPG